MITLQEYLNGYEQIYPEELTPEIRAHAEETVARVNALISELGTIETNKRGSVVNSGWRPPQINAQTKGAATKSKHMTGEACDLYDPEGALDEWCLEHPDKLDEIGLWQEHPSATKGWLHVQTVPPKSGKRVFYP